MRISPFVLVLVMLFVALTGCVSNPPTPSTPGGPGGDPFAGLAAAGATATRSGSTLAFSWKDVAGPGASDPALGSALPNQAAKDVKFDVGPGVKMLNASVKWTSAAPVYLRVEVLDGGGKHYCGTNVGENPDFCGGLLPNLSAKESWTARVVSSNAPQGNEPYTLTVTLDASAFTIAPLSSFVDPGMTFFSKKTGAKVGEPSIGVDSKGKIFVLSGTTTLRSDDRARTWKDVSAPTTSQVTADAMLRVDPYTDRVYADQLTIACSILAWSDDEGASWVTNPIACGAPSNDHQKLAIGATDLPVAPAFDGIVYYAYHGIGVSPANDMAVVSRSLDGGLTFTAAVAGDATRDGYYGGPTGPVEADRKGNVLIAWVGTSPGTPPPPNEIYPPSLWVSASHDYGVTWKAQRIAVGDAYQPPSDPAPVFDAGGNTYMVWAGPTNLWYAVSKDHGDTWGKPIDVGPKPLRSFEFSAATGGDAGTFAVFYLASEDAPYGADRAASTATWRPYVSFVTGADSGAPKVTTGLVAPGFVQRGGICLLGTACVSEDRNLLDFIAIAPDPQGHLALAYTDGCDGCATSAESRKDLSTVAVEETGPSLFATLKAPWVK